MKIFVILLVFLQLCRVNEGKLQIYFDDDVIFDWDDAASRARGFAFQQQTMTSQSLERHLIGQPIAFQQLHQRHVINDVTTITVSGIEGIDYAPPTSLIAFPVSSNQNGYSYYQLICPRHFRSLGDVMGTYRVTKDNYKCVNERYVRKSTYDVTVNHTFQPVGAIPRRLYHTLNTGGRNSGFYYVINNNDDLRVYELDINHDEKDDTEDENTMETSIIIIGSVLGLLFLVVLFILCMELRRKQITKRKRSASTSVTHNNRTDAVAMTSSNTHRAPEVQRHDRILSHNNSDVTQQHAIQLQSPAPLPEVEFFPFMTTSQYDVTRGRKTTTTSSSVAGTPYVNMSVGGTPNSAGPQQTQNICVVSTYTLPRVPEGGVVTSQRRGATSSTASYQNIVITQRCMSTNSVDDVTRVYAHNVICNPMDRGNSVRSTTTQMTSYFQPNIYEEMSFNNSLPRNSSPRNLSSAVSSPTISIESPTP